MMIVPYFPYPLVSGGQNRTYNLLKHLSSSHEITLVCFIRENNELKWLPEIKKYCKKVITIKRSRTAWELKNILLAGFSLYPFVAAIYYKKAASKAIENELKNSHYDVIHAETFYMMPNIPKTSVPILLVEQTIEYPMYDDHVKTIPWYLFFVKILYSIDVFKIKWWESYYWKTAQGLATVSEEDKDFINNLYPRISIRVIPNGVDIEHFGQTKKSKQDRPTVLFIGQFKWLPNKDAAKFLVGEIWPIIKKKIPRARLWIVGKNPTKDILELANSDKDIRIDSNVKDIREAYKKADVLLAPIRSGHGTKYKVLEAMATGTPVVGTQLATEGVDFSYGEIAHVGDTADELAGLTIKLLNDETLAKLTAKKAKQFIRENYNWNTIYRRLDALYREISLKPKN